MWIGPEWREKQYPGWPHKMVCNIHSNIRRYVWDIVKDINNETKLMHIFPAEMALATLQGFQIPASTPPITLSLSYSEQLDSPYPSAPIFPQYIKAEKTHPLYSASPQQLFSWFRSAGPLVEVRASVDVGQGGLTCTVQYWEESHAKFARDNSGNLHTALRAMPAFRLRIFDPWDLYCSVRCNANAIDRSMFSCDQRFQALGPSFKVKDIDEHFAQVRKAQKSLASVSIDHSLCYQFGPIIE